MNAPPRRARDFTEGPIARNLLLFAIPILLGNVAQSLNASINAIWIGRFLGEVALTGVVSANSILFLLNGSVFGLSMASNILVAQAVGARNDMLVRRIVGTSATFFVLLSSAIAVVGWFFAGQMLQWMNTPQASLAPGAAYLRISFLYMPLAFVFVFLMAVMRGAGDSRTPFRFLLISVVLDTVLNPVFIFGWGPIPALGVAGSACATLLAQGVSLAALLGFLAYRRHPLWLGRAHRRLYRIELDILHPLIFKGLPMGVQMIVISMAMIAMMSMVNRHGTDTAAAFGAALQLWSYIQMPAMAVGAACSSFAGQNVGAGKWNRVAGVARNGVLFNFLLTGAAIVPIVAFDHWTLALFLPPQSTATLEIARHLNHIAIWSFMFFGVSFVLSGVVRSTGAVMPPLIILVVSMWGVRVPFANFMQAWLGQDALWWSFNASASISMVLSISYYFWGNWRKTRMLPK